MELNTTITVPSPEPKGRSRKSLEIKSASQREVFRSLFGVQIAHYELQVCGKHGQSLGCGRGSISAVLQRLVISLVATLEYGITLPFLGVPIILPKFSLTSQDPSKVF